MIWQSNNSCVNLRFVDATFRPCLHRMNIGRSVEERLRHSSSNRLNNMRARCGNYVINNRNCSASSMTGGQ